MKNLYSLLILFLVFTATVKAQVSEQEFQALKAIYNATGGDNWKNRTGWENINTTATKNDVTTAWFGIREIVNGHITSFCPYMNNLTGSLPAQIGDLKWLEVLSIYSNSLTGVLPAEIGNLTSLIELNFNSNKITGPLPQEITNLSKLKYLYMSSNPINTPFPSTIIKKLFNLQILNAIQCQFSGVLPDIFDSLTALDYIELSNNQLEGEIPPSINRLKKLATLSLALNQFSGPLPTLDSCSFIYLLSLSSNNFTGSIPASYGNFTTLTSLYLGGNKISGTIPSGLFTAPFKRLHIDNNYFTFNGIEPVFSKINALDEKRCTTNKLFPLTQNNISANEGESLTLNATTLSVYPLGGNNNRYKWYKGNTEIYSGNNPSFTINKLARADAGIYRFEVTNTVVGNVILKSENITVSVVGSNLPPTDITLSVSEVNENFTGALGLLSATDPNIGDIHSFTMATGNGTNDRDNNIFNITGNQLYVNGTVDFEKRTSLNLLITVNDGNGGVFTKAFTIKVNNVNEAPLFNGQVTSNSIDENSPNGTTALTLMAQDPEGTPVVFSITAGNENGAFGIDGNKLIVADFTKLNYDAKKQYDLSVRASDGELSTTAILIITLNKINRIPVVENATFSINENSPVGTVVGSIIASDPEGEPLTITFLTGNELSAFELTGKTIKVTRTEALDFELHPVFNLTINVSDGISNVQATVIINLNDVSENTDNSILTFSVPGMVGKPTINEAAHTIHVSVRDVDLTALAATFTLSAEATSYPSSGTSLNFTSPQIISVTAQSGNTQDWIITVTQLVGKNEFENLSVIFYPNPVQNVLYLLGTENGDRVALLSLSGKKVFETEALSNKEQIDISHLASGAYLLTITSNRSAAALRIIKQ